MITLAVFEESSTNIVEFQCTLPDKSAMWLRFIIRNAGRRVAYWKGKQKISEKVPGIWSAFSIAILDEKKEEEMYEHLRVMFWRLKNELDILKLNEVTVCYPEKIPNRWVRKIGEMAGAEEVIVKVEDKSTEDIYAKALGRFGGKLLYVESIEKVKFSDGKDIQ